MNPIQQAQADQAIGQELLKIMPSGWRGLLLVARRIDGPGTKWSLKITIQPQPHAPGLALVSDDLEKRLGEMFVAHKKALTGMVEARYVVDATNPGSPSVVSEFEYAD